MKAPEENKNVYRSVAEGSHHRPLVDMDGLREALWSDAARPSRNWVRKMARLGLIPVVEVGRRVFYDVDTVRSALNSRAETERHRRAALAG